MLKDNLDFGRFYIFIIVDCRVDARIHRKRINLIILNFYIGTFDQSFFQIQVLVILFRVLIVFVITFKSFIEDLLFHVFTN